MRVSPGLEPLAVTEFTLEADLVLLAMDFTGPVKNGMIEQLGVQLEPRGNVAADADYMSSVPGVFVAGDMRRGKSLVVWAIAEGIDRYLKRMKCGITAAWCIPSWLERKSGCRGRRLSRELGNPGKQFAPWPYCPPSRTLCQVAGAPVRRWDR